MSKIQRNLKKILSYSLLDSVRFFSNFVISFAIIFVGIYISCKIKNVVFTKSVWLTAIIGSIVVVILNYIKDVIRAKKHKSKFTNEEIIYKLIGGAIEQLRMAKEDQTRNQVPYISQILRYIEKIVQIIINESETSGVMISTNLMIRNENPERLELKYFGTRYSDRREIDIRIDENKILPGAPEACFTKRMMYIPNIATRKYSVYFRSDAPYKTIISIPLLKMNGSVFAVLNIDANISNLFGKKSYITRTIIPKVKPLTELLMIEQELVSGLNSEHV